MCVSTEQICCTSKWVFLGVSGPQWKGVMDRILHYFYLEIQGLRWDQGPGRLTPFPESTPGQTDRQRPSDFVLCTGRGQEHKL